MNTRFRRLLKLAGMGLLAVGLAGLPSVAAAHGDRGHVVKVVPRGHGHYKPYSVYRYYRPRVVERRYRYYEPYHGYRPYYIVPRVYDYGYAPVYPGGNLSLTLEFPFRF